MLTDSEYKYFELNANHSFGNIDLTITKSERMSWGYWTAAIAEVIIQYRLSYTRNVGKHFGLLKKYQYEKALEVYNFTLMATKKC